MFSQDAGLSKRPVELGAEDDRYVVVLKGLNRGERVLLYEPQKL